MLKIHEMLEKRRSQYGLNKEVKKDVKEIKELIEESVKLTPSAFNSQTQRVVVLFGEQSDKFWDLTLEELRKVAPAEGFERTVEKLDSFKQGIGTILYYIEDETVEGLQKQFPLYADNFPVWAQQENGMLQLVVWTALAEAGLGANIQHYNPVVDEVTAKEFDIPATWRLVAQMPFGNPIGEVIDKQHIEMSKKVVYKD